MRLRVEIATAARELPWDQVLKPGRSIVYGLLADQAPELGRQLHGPGIGPYGMVPIGHSAPVFPNAERRRGVYAAGGHGWVEFGSPLFEVVQALAQGLKQQRLLDWGGAAFRIRAITPVQPPAFASGRARLRTCTPVVLKGSGLDGSGVRTTRQAWLLPGDREYPLFFQRNLRRKAETLGLDPQVSLERIVWVGAKRSFAVGGGRKPGVPVEVELSGPPETLRAIWSWGWGRRMWPGSAG